VFFLDTFKSLRNPRLWIISTWFRFLIKYRRTIAGPLWILANPVSFILFLGALLVGLSNFSTSVFIPFLTIGYVTWTLLGGYILRAPDIFQRNKAYLLQGDISITDIILMDNAELVVHFMHQSVLIIAVCLYFGTFQSSYALVSLVGLFLLIINGYWITLVVGTLGARFKDFGEIMGSIATIFFLATPIIWMPVKGAAAFGGKGGMDILQAYMLFNPFYHFLEIVRAPMLGEPIATLTWIVVLCFTFFGFLAGAFFYARFRHMTKLWI